MTPSDLAALHAACFSLPRPWTEPEFAALLAATGARLLTGPDGFLLARMAGGEAELLTLAVAPDARRSGQARHLVERFLDEARASGSDAAFLEVASDNTAAQALYQATGWHQVGRRRGYYAPAVDAIVMRHDLRPAGEGLTT